MEVKIPIDELTAKVIEELKRLNYSYCIGFYLLFGQNKTLILR